MQPFAKNMAVEFAAKALPDGELAQALQAQQESLNKKYTQVDAASWDLDNLTEEQSNIIESMKVILAYNGHFFVPTYYNTDTDHIYCGYTCLEVYDASTIYSKVIKYERYTPTAGSGTAELNEFTHSLGGTKLYKHSISYTIPDISIVLLRLVLMSPESQPFTLATMPGISTKVLKGADPYESPIISNIILPYTIGSYEVNYRILVDLGPRVPHYQFYYVINGVETVIDTITDIVTPL